MHSKLCMCSSVQVCNSYSEEKNYEKEQKDKVVNKVLRAALTGTMV